MFLSDIGYSWDYSERPKEKNHKGLNGDKFY